jgi:hypothetical protein
MSHRASSLWERIGRAWPRLLTAGSGFVIAVVVWPGQVGLVLGLVAAAGLIVFEFGRWREYVVEGHRPVRRLSGSARFRQPGETRVVLLSAGPHPRRVVRCIRVATKVDDGTVQRYLKECPSTVAHDLSLSSADQLVAALVAAGAEARLEVDAGSERTRP